MRRVLALVLVVAVAVSAGACADDAIIVRGIVVDIQQSSFTRVDGFTLRTSDGRLLRFVIGYIGPSSGSFPPIHLRDHLASALPIDVRYVIQHDENVALRLADVPSASP
jgi:hypothetical protein